MSQHCHGHSEQHQCKNCKNSIESILKDAHKACDCFRAVYGLRIHGKRRILNQYPVHLRSGNSCFRLHMDHHPVPGQGIHTAFFYHRQDFFISLLCNQESFHPNHGASHKRVFVISCNRQPDTLPSSCHRKGNAFPRLQSHDGFHGRRYIYFRLSNLFRSRSIAGKVIPEETVPSVLGVGNQLPLTVGFHSVGLIIRKDQFLYLGTLHTLLSPDALQQKLRIRHI